MTEDQIERRVERMIDSLDARFMRGTLSREEYDREMDDITAWANLQYSQMVNV